jgi:hypothetical protein
VFSDILYHNLANADYVVDTARLQKGVFFKADTAGAYRVITLAQYRAAGGDQWDAGTPPTSIQRNAILQAIVTAGNDVNLYLAAYQFSDVSVVWIDKGGGVGSNINIGLY